MAISAEEIEEVVEYRPYGELPSSALNRLLDAFESFLPGLEGYSLAAEDILEDHPEADVGSLPTALTLSETIEPTVSRAIFELLAELLLRDLERDIPEGARYEGWDSRGLFYGFDSSSLSMVAELAA